MIISNNENIKILILGHKGLLGNQVLKYYESIGADTFKTDLRWPSEEFKNFVKNFEGIIINCIGSIPQKGNLDYSVNYELPSFLLENNKKFIQPDTDCVFSGNIDKGKSYHKNDIMDATGPYAESKIKFINEIKDLKNVDNFRIIRTSIIGFDKQNKSIMSWFLKTSKETGECQGYENHLWNGITTLEWSKLSYRIIREWKNYSLITQVGSNHISKLELLNLFSDIFDSPCNIKSVSTGKIVNKCLKSDLVLPDIKEQLQEMVSWRHNEK